MSQDGTIQTVVGKRHAPGSTLDVRTQSSIWHGASTCPTGNVPYISPPPAPPSPPPLPPHPPPPSAPPWIDGKVCRFVSEEGAICGSIDELPPDEAACEAAVIEAAWEEEQAQHTAFMDSLEPDLRLPPPPPSPRGLAIAPNTAPVALDVVEALLAEVTASLRRAPPDPVVLAVEAVSLASLA